ncbi:hypothetical protein G7046_g7061 [Stylonectria norvegica]|nr:hypothetical protein G7046_g7061 [Stylonectria norvegica]
MDSRLIDNRGIQSLIIAIKDLADPNLDDDKTEEVSELWEELHFAWWDAVKKPKRNLAPFDIPYKLTPQDEETQRVSAFTPGAQYNEESSLNNWPAFCQLAFDRDVLTTILDRAFRNIWPGLEPSVYERRLALGRIGRQIGFAAYCRDEEVLIPELFRDLYALMHKNIRNTSVEPPMLNSAHLKAMYELSGSEETRKPPASTLRQGVQTPDSKHRPSHDSNARKGISGDRVEMPSERNRPRKLLDTKRRASHVSPNHAIGAKKQRKNNQPQHEEEEEELGLDPFEDADSEDASPSNKNKSRANDAKKQRKNSQPHHEEEEEELGLDPFDDTDSEDASPSNKKKSLAISARKHGKNSQPRHKEEERDVYSFIGDSDDALPPNSKKFQPSAQVIRASKLQSRKKPAASKVQAERYASEASSDRSRGRARNRGHNRGQLPSGRHDRTITDETSPIRTSGGSPELVELGSQAPDQDELEEERLEKIRKNRERRVQALETLRGLGWDDGCSDDDQGVKHTNNAMYLMALSQLHMLEGKKE